MSLGITSFQANYDSEIMVVYPGLRQGGGELHFCAVKKKEGGGQDALFTYFKKIGGSATPAIKYL